MGGKKKFRPFVEIFIDPVFRNVNHNHQLCAISAQDFLLSLEKIYGPNIMRGILEQGSSRYVDEFEKFKQQMGVPGGDFVYPTSDPFGRPMAPGHSPYPGAQIGRGDIPSGPIAGGMAPWAVKK